MELYSLEVHMDAEIVRLAEREAAICRIFSNPTRILIVWTLTGRELSVTDVASAINSSLQNTSQHLRLMRVHGILASHKVGNTVYYHIPSESKRHDCRVMNIANDIHIEITPEERKNDR